MFFDNYPLKISAYVKPVFFKGLKTAPAVLLIHGFGGCPHEMLWLGEQLNQGGYTVSIPRLPGHGTNKADFLSTKRTDWLRHVCDEYINLKAEHDVVHVGGFSMGGLLAALVAAKFNPDKVFLAAPAFRVFDKRIALTPFLKFFVKQIREEETMSKRDPARYNALKDYYGVEYTAQVAELYALQKLAIKHLPYIKASVLTILSEKDPHIPLTVKDLLSQRIKSPVQYCILKKSGHLVVTDVEREILAKSVIEFLHGN